MTITMIPLFGSGVLFVPENNSGMMSFPYSVIVNTNSPSFCLSFLPSKIRLFSHPSFPFRNHYGADTRQTYLFDIRPIYLRPVSKMYLPIPTYEPKGTNQDLTFLPVFNRESIISLGSVNPKNKTRT